MDIVQDAYAFRLLLSWQLLSHHWVGYLLRKAYLKMHRPILFNELALFDKLFEHCAEIDEAARSRMELIVPELAKQYGVTEQG